MSRIVRHLVGMAAFALIVSTAHSTLAVSPKPLENAYWRFEEGSAGSPVTPGNNDYVKDSINANHMRAFDSGTTPDYTTSVAPTPLKSGLANSLALSFTTHDDLYTDTKNINNGMIGPPVAPNVSGFTIEAAFQPSAFVGFQGIVGREGQPNGSLNETLELKIRGDNHLLQIEQFDKAGNQVQVSSINQMNIGQWYYSAVVNDGSNLSLYLDSNDGNGYVLQGTTPVNGALYQGTNDWDKTWSIGRGFYNGNPADWFNGIIDEVRLSNSALAPSDFLFAQGVFPGDYNGDKIVDAGDYNIWRKTNVLGDPGYTAWRSNFGKNYNLTGSGSLATSIPEPASLVIAAIAFAGVAAVRRRNRQ
jgi:Concanavalin A-like lectin/glucanases superfamily